MVLVYRLCFPFLRFFFRILVLFSFSFSSLISFFVFVLALFSFHSFPCSLSPRCPLFPFRRFLTALSTVLPSFYVFTGVVTRELLRKRDGTIRKGRIG